VNIPATIEKRRRVHTRQSAEARAELTSKIIQAEFIRFGTDAVADVIDDYLTSARPAALLRGLDVSLLEDAYCRLPHRRLLCVT
jgi:hypothetical protein